MCPGFAWSLVLRVAYPVDLPEDALTWPADSNCQRPTPVAWVRGIMSRTDALF